MASLKFMALLALLFAFALPISAFGDAIVYTIDSNSSLFVNYTQNSSVVLSGNPKIGGTPSSVILSPVVVNGCTLLKIGQPIVAPGNYMLYLDSITPYTRNSSDFLRLRMLDAAGRAINATEFMAFASSYALVQCEPSMGSATQFDYTPLDGIYIRFMPLSIERSAPSTCFKLDNSSTPSDYCVSSALDYEVNGHTKERAVQVDAGSYSGYRDSQNKTIPTSLISTLLPVGVDTLNVTAVSPYPSSRYMQFEWLGANVTLPAGQTHLVRDGTDAALSYIQMSQDAAGYTWCCVYGATIRVFETNVSPSYQAPIASPAPPLAQTSVPVAPVSPSGGSDAVANIGDSAANAAVNTYSQSSYEKNVPLSVPTEQAVGPRTELSQLSPPAPADSSTLPWWLAPVIVASLGAFFMGVMVFYYRSPSIFTPSQSTPAPPIYLSDSRLALMSELAQTERIPTDIAARLGKSKSTISEQLEELCALGLVERISQPGKKFVFYRLSRSGRQALLQRADEQKKPAPLLPF